MSDFTYAVIDAAGVVENIVLADGNDAVDVLRLLIPDAQEILLTTSDTGPAYIGGDLVEGRFRMPSPYPSWLWNSESFTWQAPILYPQDDRGYVWDEELQEWTPMPPFDN